MDEERSLEGWVPPADADLAEVIDLAFDYRGDVTVVMAGGAERVGYVYNRRREVADPYLEMFDPDGTAHRLPYAEIRAIRFTGKDTAAGKSYEAWLRRRTESAPGT